MVQNFLVLLLISRTSRTFIWVFIMKTSRVYGMPTSEVTLVIITLVIIGALHLGLQKVTDMVMCGQLTLIL